MNCLSVAIALGLLIGPAQPTSVNAQEKSVPAVVESQEVTAIVEKYRTCVAEAVAVTTPELIPDKAVRKVAFETLVEGCDKIKKLRLRSAALDAEMEARTKAIINGAKAELGLKS